MIQMTEAIRQILDYHRKGYADIQAAVRDLENCYLQQSPENRKTFFQFLWPEFYSTPLTSQAVSLASDATHTSPTIHAVIIRACAAFGPTGELPSHVFGLLRWNDLKLMETWAERVCPEFAYSLVNYSENFSEATLNNIKAQCSIFTFAQGSELTGHHFPASLTEAAVRLVKAVEQIEYRRFAQNLAAGVPKAKREPADLVSSLEGQGLDKDIADAVKRAEGYLESAEPFSPKTAGDLLRTSIDELHRGIVKELAKITGQPYSGEDKDGARRLYMRETEFITHAEEKFFSTIYTLISEEASHKLDAPRETMLFMATVVHGYLQLLLRRLSDERHSSSSA